MLFGSTFSKVVLRSFCCTFSKNAFALLLVKVILKSGKDASLKRWHPWVFSGAIYAISDGEPLEGEIVKVYDYQKNFLAIGYYNQNTTISIKVLSFDNTNIDSVFWKEKIQNAIQLRKDLNYYSLEVYGQSFDKLKLQLEVTKNQLSS